MTTEMATMGPAGRLSVSDLVANKDIVLGAIKAAMEQDQDYGVISGTQKNTLYKPGAEKLLMMFKLCAEPETVTDLSTSDEARYRVLTKVVHAPTGTVVGYGVGEASSNEEKYKWRKATCQEEYDETPEDRKRHKWVQKVEWKKAKSGKSYPEKVYDKETRKPVMDKLLQVRTNHADLANTILKMADKRSFVGATLKVTAASAVFTQDLEDLNEELQQVVVEAEAPKAAPPETITEPQRASETAAAGEPPIEMGGPSPAVAAAQSQVTKPKADPAWKSMASKVDGGTCATCRKPIAQGSPIYFNGKAGQAHHSDHFA